MHASFTVRGHTISGLGARRLSASCFAALALVLSCAWPMPLMAQVADGDFEGEKTWTDKAGKTHDITGTPKDAKARSAYNKILSRLRNEGKTSSDSDEEAFENFAQHLVRQLTWKENIAKLPEHRKELKKFLIQFSKGKAPDLHVRLNKLALQVCTEVAKDAQYPRAVRFNCVLMLADLDEREYNAGASQPQAVPLPGATTALVELLADEQQPLFIRYGAVLAVARHIQPTMPAALQGQAAEALVKIMAAPIPEGKQMAGQVWFHFRAGELLQAMIEQKLPVDQAALASSLMTLLADEKLPFWARSAYAGDLGRLDSKSLPADKTGPAAQALDGLVLAILQSSPFMPDEAAAEEADDKKDTRKDAKKKDEKKDDKSARDANTDKEKQGDDEKKKEQEEISPDAQKLLSEEIMWQLARIRRALYGRDAPVGKSKGPEADVGLYAAAGDADKATIDKIVEQLDKCVKVLVEVPDNLDQVAETLRDANQELEDLLPAPVVDQEQTALADDEDGAEKVADNAAAASR